MLRAASHLNGLMDSVSTLSSGQIFGLKVIQIYQRCRKKVKINNVKPQQSSHIKAEIVSAMFCIILKMSSYFSVQTILLKCYTCWDWFTKTIEKLISMTIWLLWCYFGISFVRFFCIGFKYLSYVKCCCLCKRVNGINLLLVY